MIERNGNERKRKNKIFIYIYIYIYKEREREREREREIFDKRENLNLLHNDKIGSTRVFIIH